MLRRISLALILSVAFLDIACVAASRQGRDLTEFATVSEATAFGWTPSVNTKLTITDEHRVGLNALRIEAGPNAGEYSGADLNCLLDLTGAGPNDRLVFFVKQNYGTGMRVQLWTETGPVNRSFSVKHDGWTRIELDLDIKHWENPKNAKWGPVTRIQFYEKGFNAEQHYMILDGLAITVNKHRVSPRVMETLTSWSFPQETDEAWRIGNEDAAWAVSKKTGQVIGGWNVRTRDIYLASLTGRYLFEDRHTKTSAIENEDVVQKVDFNSQTQHLELTCFNPAMTGLVINKTYWVEGNKLYHRIAFTTSSDELQFITYNAQAHFNPSYRNSGYYMGGADGGGPLMPAPEIASWQKITEYQNTPKGMVLSQPDLNYSFAHVRTRLDNRFVWPWFTGAIASYCEPANIMHYTPDGWDMSLGTSKIPSKKQTSYEQYLSIFEGDWQTFLHTEYALLPDAQQALDEIPPTPDWVSDIIVDSLADITKIERLLEVTDEGNIMVLVDLGGSWADYYVDKGLEGGWGGGSITGEEIRDLIHRLKALSPRIKVGIYMWVLSTMEETRIFQDHPEWFRITNKEGENVNTFPGVRTNYAHLLSIPECYDALLSQFDLVLEYLDTDFIYLDDPKAINPIDWSSGEYTRDDLSFQFMLDIKRIAASHGPDKMVFFNNRGNPYADVNYIEARSMLDANYWRHLAGICAVIQQFITSTRPDSRIVPLYYIPPYERDYINRVLALGWIPEVGNSNITEILERRAFVQAAYEVGNCASIPATYHPNWKRDKQTQVESYAVQRYGDPGYLISFIDHHESSRIVPVTINIEDLSLPSDQTLFIWRYDIENANAFKGSATEGMARDAYANADWMLDHVTQRTLVYCGPYRKTISIDVPMNPLLLHQLYITSQPTAVYSENNLSANYLFNQTKNISLQDATDWDSGIIEVQIESERDIAEIVAFLPLSDYHLIKATIDGTPIKPKLVYEGNNVYPIFQVERGSHTLRVEFEKMTTARTAPIKIIDTNVTAETLSISLSTKLDALLTIERNGRVVYSQVSKYKQGFYHLPLANTRPSDGQYSVTVRAIIDQEGRVRTVKASPMAVSLPSAEPDPRLTTKSPSISRGMKQINEVDRHIHGVHVLRSAVTISDSVKGTFQPELDALIAQVDLDTLSLEAGTTRKIEIKTGGAAFAGLEIANLRQVEISLSNTFHDAFHIRGKGIHFPPYNASTRPFAGIVVDYHTPTGYTKRVNLATGVLHSDCSSIYPNYGKAAEADEYLDLGKVLIESPQQSFTLDLEKYAPDDWDGQVWISVGSDWVAGDRRLTMRILSINEDANYKPLEATDPSKITEAFMQPKSLQVPRSPGGILIDGPSDEEWWYGAAITEQFYLHNAEGISDADTTAKLLYDDDNLYIAFICQEPSRKQPLAQSGQIWDDDEIEVWLDINRDQETYTQILINSVNEHVVYNESGPTPIAFKSATAIEQGDRWMVEIAIPFSSLGVQQIKPGDTWNISLCRYRPGNNTFNSQMIVWAPLQKNGFKDLANFGTITFK